MHSYSYSVTNFKNRWSLPLDNVVVIKILVLVAVKLFPTFREVTALPDLALVFLERPRFSVVLPVIYFPNR